MSSFLFLSIPALAVLLLAAPLFPVYRGITTGKKARRSIVCNLCAFFGLCIISFIVPLGDLVAYAAVESDAIATALSTGDGLGLMGAALVTGLSSLGGGIAVASAAPAAIGATSEDPKSFGKSLIFVVLGEGIALYGLLISILIINKI